MILTKEIEYRGKKIKVSSLKPNTDKRVWVECPLCNNIRYTYYKSIKDDQTCHSCAVKMKRSLLLDIGARYGRLTVIIPYLSGKSLCVCDCGTESIYDNYNLVSDHTKSCGCLRKDNARIVGRDTISSWKGDNHPNWKGGITSERQLFNTSKSAKEWRKSVFQRDQYTCQHCGSIGGKLNAHHIKQYSLFPELRLDVNNGITLCESCHREEHKKIGKKKIMKHEKQKYSTIPHNTSTVERGRIRNPYKS